MPQKILQRLARIPVPILLLFASILAYGLLLPLLGFYWDDLPNMWVYHMFGAGGFITYASNHRPFSAWVFILTTFFLGENPLGYHILALLLRWAGSVAFWWAFKQVWPSNQRQVAWAAFLFAIYPGFRELPIATVFNVHLMCLALTLFSLGGMVWCVRHPRHFWLMLVASVAASAISIFTMEYFITLELLRPFLIWLFLRQSTVQPKAVLKKVFIFSLPYFLILAVYSLWRIFIFKFPYYEPVLIESNKSLFERVITLLPLMWNSILRSALVAWISPFTAEDGNLMGRMMMLLYWLVLFLGGLISFLTLLYRENTEAVEPNRSTRWSLQAIILGFLALFLSGWPIWIAGLQVELEPLDSRFTLPFMVGSALLLGGILDLIPVKNTIKVAILSTLVGVSIGWHLRTTNVFRYEWDILKDTYWQLTWRAPSIKPGTALLANDIPFRYYSDNSLTAMLNWTYAPDNSSLDMPYLLDFTSVRLGSGIPALAPGLPLTQDYSILSFKGSTDQIIAVFAISPSCVRLLDKRLDDGYQRLPTLTGQATNLSQLTQITFGEQAYPPRNLFGSAPKKDWCYYFEKADLARQLQDWQAIVDYGEVAFQLNDNPNEATERLPFIEGYAHMGYWSRALELSKATVTHGKSGVLRMLCNTWDRIDLSVEDSPDKEQAIQIVNTEYQCQEP